MNKLKTSLLYAFIVANLLAFNTFAAEGIMPFRKNSEDSRFNFHATDANSLLRIRVVEQYHWEPGLQAERRTQFVDAYGSWDFILRWVPNHVPALRKMMDLVILHKRPDLVIPYLEEAVSFCPSCTDVAILYGIYYQRVGQPDKAIEKYKKALETNAYSIDAHYNLGLALIEKGKLAEANEHAQLAYEYGHRLPGLRNKLQKAGAWKPLPPSAPASDTKTAPAPDPAKPTTGAATPSASPPAPTPPVPNTPSAAPTTQP